MRVSESRRPESDSSESTLSVGTVIGKTAEGNLLIACDGAPKSVTIAVPAFRIGDMDPCGHRVVLAYEHGQPERPIALGLLRTTVDGDDDRASRGRADRTVLKAGEEFRIECGDASISMRRDGTIVIKGKRIISRAESENKIRGATVLIN